MEKLIIPTLPNILNMIGIGITIVMGVSFIVFVIGIMTNKFKIAEVCYVTFLASMSLGLMMIIYIAIVGHAPIDKNLIPLQKQMTQLL